MRGMTKTQQGAARKAIKSRGMSILGWARANNLNENNVVSVLYRGYGTAHTLTSTAVEIVGKLREQGLVGERTT